MSKEMLKSTQVIITEIDRLDRTISLSGKSMQVQPLSLQSQIQQLLQAVQLRDTIIEKLYQELRSLNDQMRNHMATHQEVINSSKEVKKERDRLKKGFEL